MVVWTDDLTDAALHRIGPFVTAHPALAHGANVQLARPDGGGRCRALIWERGVGKTSASGTSSCAVAVVAVVRGVQPPGRITIHMEGGVLTVDVTDDLDVVLRGPVEEVCEGGLTPGFLSALASGRGGGE